METLKNRVKEFRFRHDDMTQQMLAAQVAVTRQTIHAIEKGRFNPSVKLALKIAQVFGAAVEDIFYLAEEEQ